MCWASFSLLGCNPKNAHDLKFQFVQKVIEFNKKLGSLTDDEEDDDHDHEGIQQQLADLEHFRNRYKQTQQELDVIKGKLKAQERKALLGFLDLLLCAVGTVTPEDLGKFTVAAVTRPRIQYLSELVGNASPAVRLQGVPSLGFLARTFEDWRVAPSEETYVWKCLEIVQLLRHSFGKYLQLSKEKKLSLESHCPRTRCVPYCTHCCVRPFCANITASFAT